LAECCLNLKFITFKVHKLLTLKKQSMKKDLLFLLFPVLLFSQIPTGYYDGTSGLSGYALKSKLHEIISKNTISLNYADLKLTMENVDIDNYYDQDGSLLDFYTTFPGGGSVHKYFIDDIISTAGSEGMGYNREHVMPQSTFSSDYPMYSDMFYIFPGDAYINQRRSNNPYGEVVSPNYEFTNGTKIGPSVTPGKTGTVLEPIDEFKGDIARMLLYFVVRYEGKLNFFAYDVNPNPLEGKEEIGFEQWYIDQLVLWSKQDPVSQSERDRNDKIYALQNNRNPFIDHPEWVEKIWKSTLSTSVPSTPENLNLKEAGAYFLRLEWTPSTGALGYKILLNGTQITTTSLSHYDIGNLNPSTSYNVQVVAYNDIYSESSPAQLSATTLDSDDYAKDLMITKYIEGSDYNKALEITNHTGYDVDLKKYRIAKQATGITNAGAIYYYTTGSYQLEGILEKGKTLVLMNNQAEFQDYNLENADVKTNSDALNFSGWQYIELNYDNTKETGNRYPKTVEAIGYFGQNQDYGKDVSLYRNSDVKHPNYQFTPSEWTQYPQDYIVGLGDVLEVKEAIPSTKIKIYPNPVIQGILYVQGENLNQVKLAQIYDTAGNLVQNIENPFKGFRKEIKVQNLPAGVYILKLDAESFKFIKK